MKRIWLFIIMLLVFPIIGLADVTECSMQDRERLQKMVDNVSYIIEEKKDDYGNFNGYFRLIFSGVSNELYFSDNLGYVYSNYEDYDYGEFFTRDISQGVKYQIQISGYNTCQMEKFRTITINFPIYNSYYGDPLCSDARALSVCNKWGIANISYDEFASRVQEYKNSKSINIPVNDDTNNNWLYNIYQKYYWYGLIGMIIFLGVLIFLWVKEQQKNSL